MLIITIGLHRMEDKLNVFPENVSPGIIEMDALNATSLWIDENCRLARKVGARPFSLNDASGW